MIDSLLTALWFFLPAGLANMSPVLLARLPGIKKWNTPLDLGKSYRGKRIFGENKTWRGVIGGTLVATMVVFVQHWLALQPGVAGVAVGYISGPFNYFDSGIMWLGPLMGLGALVGDALESFFKRRVGVKAGDSWFPFDQVDYIFGGLFAASFMIRIHPQDALAVIIVYFGLHLLVSYIGHKLGLKKSPI